MPSSKSLLALSVPESDSPFEDPLDQLLESQPKLTQQPDQPNPITPQQPEPQIMAAPLPMHSFSGEPGDDVQLGEFLKTFHRFLMYACITENRSIINTFGDHLTYGSLADEWFSKLDATTSTWKEVEKEFLQHFPPVKKAKQTETELERSFAS